MSAFWLSLVAVFMLELGDKTQLVAMSLAAHFNVRVVLAGILAATLLVHVVSVILGWCAGSALPRDWISLIAGLAFVGFGFWTLRGDCLDDDDESPKCKVASPFMLVAVTFFLAELGDKTMLGTVALATNNPVIPVWLGSSLGMVLSDGLAILIGHILCKALPERVIKLGASVIFFLFGAYSMILGAIKLPPYSWGIAAVALALMTGLYVRGMRSVKVAGATALLPQEEPEA